MNPSQRPELWSLHQVLDFLGIGKFALYEWIACGKFPKPIKLGSRSRWDAEEVRQDLQRRKDAR